MKSVQLIELHKDLENREIPTPQPQNDEVLIRIKAAGICHSDVHYQEGVASVAYLPITLGHEIAGIVEELGSNVSDFEVGDRVCVNYMITCGKCNYCISGNEQFCLKGKMIGKGVDGGYAEFIALPTRGVFKIPDALSFEHAAVMMCSSATSLHALKKTNFLSGDSLAIFGMGGLGVSALQLAKTFDSGEIYAVDIDPTKLVLAEKMGAITINATEVDPSEKIMELTDGEGVDVALELVGLPLTMEQALNSLATFGRLGLVGITQEPFQVDSYATICREKQIIGCSDHLLSEISHLLVLAKQGKIDLSQVVTNKVPLEADAINEVLHQLKNFKAGFRTVIMP